MKDKHPPRITPAMWKYLEEVQQMLDEIEERQQKLKKLLDWMEEEKPRIPKESKNWSWYRDQKSATHTTVSGKGKVSNLLKKKDK